MAESLFFRKGTLAELNSSALINGSVNFTTDEPAIYLDITNEAGKIERRRVGDIIQFDTIDDFVMFKDAHQGKIPTSAFYYIVGNASTGYVNALLKWTGTDYIQVNSVSDVTADLEGINSQITTLQNDYVNLNKTAVEQGNAINSLDERVKTLEEQSGNIEIPDDLVQQVESNASNITDLQNTIVNKANKSEVNQLSAAVASKAEASTVSNMEERLAAAEETVLSLESDSTDYEGRIAALENNSTSFITQEQAQALVKEDIAAANAMTFKETPISKYSDLPIAQVKIGDTYVVASSFNNNGESYYAGDLIVASGVEEDGYITDISWIHVETGYIHEQQPEISGNDNKIYLSSHVAAVDAPGDLGIISIDNTDDTNVKATIVDNKITLTMEWGSF